MPELETITAALAEGYKQLEPESFRTSAELTTERRTNKELRKQWYYTSNFGMYDVEEGKAILYFGGREANPVLANIDEACRQLINEGNYKVTDPEKQAVVDSVKSGHTLRVKLSDLDLKRYDNEFSFFEINTDNYANLNESQRALAEKVYGSGDDFIENMKMLSEAGISNTRIYVLNQDYVKEHVKEGAVGRVGWLGGFVGSSNFSAVGRDVDNGNGLRGVRKEVGEADDAKNLVSLNEDKLHDVLADYLGPAILSKAKKDIAKLYQ